MLNRVLYENTAAVDALITADESGFFPGHPHRRAPHHPGFCRQLS
jgi:hypothetical protein